MATVASPPRPVGAAPPPVRHGTCRLTLRIGGTEYRLRPMPAPAGFRVVWALKKLDPHGPVVHYSVALPKGEPAGCTCPDHEQRGSICKHIMALAALGLLPRPKAARPPKARTPSTPGMPGRPSPRPRPCRPRRAATWRRSSPARGLELRAAWPPRFRRPGPAAPSFAAGFRQAVAAHVGRLNGTAALDPTWPICAGCGAGIRAHGIGRLLRGLLAGRGCPVNHTELLAYVEAEIQRLGRWPAPAPVRPHQLERTRSSFDSPAQFRGGIRREGRVQRGMGQVRSLRSRLGRRPAQASREIAHGVHLHN